MNTMNKTIRSVARRTFLAAAIAAAGLGVWSNAVAAAAGPVDLSVIDRETGRELPVWSHDGRLFVAGRPGARYGLRASNHTDGRVLVVMSVDGVNVVTGETARYDQRGYVLAPYETYDVTGWRKSNAQVAAFNFAALPASYAARTGRPGDVGVIGMAVFNEKASPADPYGEATAAAPPQWRSRSGPMIPPMAGPAAAPLPTPLAPLVAPAPMARAAGDSRASSEASIVRREEKLGTAHGARESSQISLVAFDRATTYPQSTRRIEYDTYANLVARGVVRPPSRLEPRPRPFPGESDADGYVPDPSPGL